MTVEEWLGVDNVIGQDIWRKKYQYNNETLDEWFDRISGGDKYIRELIEQKKFLFGGRILANRGIKDGTKHSFSNCYYIPIGDSIEEIFECAKKCARTYSVGGGCGIDIGALAPNGAKVRNAAKESSGAISFMDLFSLTTGTISQRGRRGALMISMPCSHPDIEEFINVKKDLNRVTKANVSVKFSDEFMEDVIENKNYETSFTRLATGETIRKEINAKKLMQNMAQNNWEMAEPGALYWDRITGWNYNSENPEYRLGGTNPCVSGDTLILTNQGYLPIKDLADKKMTIWNGYEWSEVTPQVTGHNQEMLLIKTSDGNSLRCTRYHKFILHDGTRVEAQELHIGDKLVKCNFPIIDSSKDSTESNIPYTQGFFMGDGCITTERQRPVLYLYGEKRQLVSHLAKGRFRKGKDRDCIEYEKVSSSYSKDYVPGLEYSVTDRLNWLAGYIDSDGGKNADGSVSISSVNYEVLLKTQHLIHTLGYGAKIGLMKNAKLKYMPTHNGDMKEYECRPCYRLVLSSSAMRKLTKLGLSTHRISVAPSPNRDASRFNTIVDIQEDGICDTVYCFNEPKNHSGIFNGIIAGNCGELPLPDYGACLLGSINLPEFVNKHNRFDEIEFSQAVRLAVRALDTVLTEGIPLHPLKEQQETAEKWRQIGLGVMGVADMLIKMELEYGSEQAVAVCNHIAALMAKAAFEASVILAKNRGAYPACNITAISESPFFKNLDYQFAGDEAWEDCKAKFMETGIRNSTLLTIAPTGTLATMIQVSGGAEPIFANSYTRKTESLDGKDSYYKIYTPIVEKYLEEHWLHDESELPDYFVTAHDICPADRISMQAAWQEFVDNSISSTINLPNSATPEDILDIYIKAWRSGLKGVTVYRDGCSRTGILTEENPPVKKTEETVLGRGYIIKTSDDLIGKKRKLMTGCGSLHLQAFFDPETGELMETFFSKGSSGGCMSFMNSLSRMISLSARSGCDFESIIDQLESSITCPSYAVRKAVHKDTSPGNCCPMAIGRALKDMHDEMLRDINDATLSMEELDCPYEESKESVVTVADKCPECGTVLANANGCQSCPNCGWSRCG